MGVLSVATIAVLISQGAAAPRDELKDFMRAKLKHSQRVLEGLVMEDFDEVAKGAQEMSLLSLAASWQVLQTPEYLDFSRKFRTAADVLSEKAKKKDLTGATTAFNQLTVRCVECHKYVRAVRMADAR
jgi:cytochrome c556